MIVIVGDPVPAGRPRTDFKRKRVYEPKENARYRKLVAQQIPAVEPFPAGAPLRLDTVFFLARPRTHYRVNGELKPWAPKYHTKSKLDFDNLAKLIADCMTGVVWPDDGQVAEARIRKLYVNERHPEPCTHVTIALLDS